LSEGARYQELELASQDLVPRSATRAIADGLDGWSFLMRTGSRDFALAYFENQALRPQLLGFTPGAAYRWVWFDPRSGAWGKQLTLKADATGKMLAPPFPKDAAVAAADMAAKIVRAQ
jgi:hypothetical protein